MLHRIPTLQVALPMVSRLGYHQPWHHVFIFTAIHHSLHNTSTSYSNSAYSSNLRRLLPFHLGEIRHCTIPHSFSTKVQATFHYGAGVDTTFSTNQVDCYSCCSRIVQCHILRYISQLLVKTAPKTTIVLLQQNPTNPLVGETRESLKTA